MSNLTISVDDRIIKLARVRAIEQGTSLSAKVREFLQHYVSQPDAQLQLKREQSAARLMQAIEAATAQTASGAVPRPRAVKGRPSLRDELYKDDFRARDRRAVRADRVK
jgi:plasmid stability protein